MSPKILSRQPIQLWDSALGPDIFTETYARDFQRAQREWRDDDKLWLIPGASSVTHWYSRCGPLLFRECIIPSESFDIINVYYMDEGKRLFPAFRLPDTWNGILPDGLYRLWLGIKPAFVPAPKDTVMEIPEWKEGKLRLTKRPIIHPPGPIMPIHSVDSDKGMAYCLWPPKGADVVPPVSPETKSAQYYGKLSFENSPDENKAYVTSENDPEMRALHVSLSWPAPFDKFFPAGGGWDLLYHQTRMKDCIARLNKESHYEILQEAQSWVGRFTAEAEASLEKAWLMPKIVTNEEEALFAVEGRFNVSATSIRDLLRSKSFVKERITLIKVLRIHSWLGYFWWEFYQDIKEHVTIKICQNCGGIIRGGRTDRQYCIPKDNPDCFRARSSLRQRKRRE